MLKIYTRSVENSDNIIAHAKTLRLTERQIEVVKKGRDIIAEIKHNDVLILNELKDIDKQLRKLRPDDEKGFDKIMQRVEELSNLTEENNKRMGLEVQKLQSSADEFNGVGGSIYK